MRPDERSRPSSARVRPFLILCFALTWVPWALLGLLGYSADAGIGVLVFGVAACGPSLAAAIPWAVDRSGRARDGVRPAWSAVALALVLGAVPAGVAAVLLNGTAAIPLHVAAVTATVGGPLVVIAYTLVAGPLAEEFGWRGYLQPRLRRSWGALGTAGIVGVAWALWHVPLYLLPGTGQFRDGLLSVEALLFFVSLIPMSYSMLFVTERLRGGVPAAIAFHAAHNAAVALLPPSGAVEAAVRCAVIVVIAAAVASIWRPSDPLPAVTGAADSVRGSR